ncbi:MULTISPECIES: DUF4166 domain-containing protein [Oleiagrimonas]|uniref:DUF4166 domain-containing protein n=1 Tax=Oleiagrimonas citrea TaxID=1665687 RepID=A0A846ZIZ2_9GAMM|nr:MULTISPECIES: DUF4166 domain-containing protein [Oleiagrimonas]NKZ37553.1 DUF4166 domain-containing protein [Oleiagrimonas citrea]RAP56170.1 hypothetical protein BTJ49_14420 [Oleiagrimonas sp. MCCC 1A03011]
MNETSLYQHLMQRDFEALEPEVRQFHALRGHVRLQGRCLTRGPRNPLARLLARVMRLPGRSGESALTFELIAEARRESWIRHFPSCCMRSVLCADGDRLVERLGPARLYFRLRRIEGRLDMQLLGVRVFGVPWPRFLSPTVHAREHGRDRQFHFDVATSMPWIGHVVAYSGHLDLNSAERLS